MNARKIAFVLGTFPTASETFIIDQLSYLKNNGFEIDIFSFKKGSLEGVSSKYLDEDLDHFSNLEIPDSRVVRLIRAVPKIIKTAIFAPGSFLRILRTKEYRRSLLCLEIFFWVSPFVGKSYDLVHCHFGTTANKFLIIKDILDKDFRIITTFYGRDVSVIVRKYGPGVYSRLKKESKAFIVMSNNMKQRLINIGFEDNKIYINPPGIDVDSYRFSRKYCKPNERVEIISVGRFVEKKGFDDLLRALTLVKDRITRPFRCTVVGDGRLRGDILKLTKELNLEKEVKYTGYMTIENIKNLFNQMHFFVQPSKTAKNGDME